MLARSCTLSWQPYTPDYRTRHFQMQPQPYKGSQTRGNYWEARLWFGPTWLGSVVRVQWGVVSTCELPSEAWPEKALVSATVEAHPLCHVDFWQRHNLDGGKERQYGHFGSVYPEQKHNLSVLLHINRLLTTSITLCQSLISVLLPHTSRCWNMVCSDA